jgi:ubiquinone/menaquinone biosynthesis C-methylase UbiE
MTGAAQMLSIFEKKSRALPIEKVLARAERLVLRATRQPSAQVATALLEIAPVLRAWGRRSMAARIEQACKGRPAASITGGSVEKTALELAAAARRLRETHDQIRASFDRDASDEERFPSTIDSRISHVRLLLDFFGDLSGKRILDAGCGKGRFARILHERHPSAEVWGLDISAEMLRCAPAGVRTRQGVLTDLPFADGWFDAAYAVESLEHAVEIEAAVAELCRVTRPGGRLVVIDKNIEQAGRLATQPWEKWFGRREMERLLRRRCRAVSSEFISYWEDVAPDGLFLAWKAVR